MLDASVALTWALKDENDARAAAVLSASLSGYVVVPALFPTEVLNTLLMSERRQRITAAEGRIFLRKLDSLDIRIEQNTWALSEEALVMARSEHLTVYDATYLCLALRLSLPLASFDTDLRRAAVRQEVILLA